MRSAAPSTPASPRACTCSARSGRPISARWPRSGSRWSRTGSCSGRARRTRSSTPTRSRSARTASRSRAPSGRCCALDLAAAPSLEALSATSTRSTRRSAPCGRIPARSRRSRACAALLRGGALLDGARRPRVPPGPARVQGGPPGARRRAPGARPLRGGAARSSSPARATARSCCSRRSARSRTATTTSPPWRSPLDYARLGLAQAVTISGERVQKLLTTRLHGPPDRPARRRDGPAEGLRRSATARRALRARRGCSRSPCRSSCRRARSPRASRGASRWRRRRRAGCTRWPGSRCASPRSSSSARRRRSTCAATPGSSAPARARTYEEVRRTVQFVGRARPAAGELRRAHALALDRGGALMLDTAESPA